MIYDKRPNFFCNGQWHCPFSHEWVKKMRHVVKVCEQLTAEDIEAFDRGNVNYQLPQWDVLNEPQDARGLPLSWCWEQERRFRRKKYPTSCTATWDYDSIPEIVITNGEEDWPLLLHARIDTA